MLNDGCRVRKEGLALPRYQIVSEGHTHILHFAFTYEFTRMEVRYGTF